MSRPIQEALERAAMQRASQLVPVVWSITDEGTILLWRWKREGLIDAETPWLRDLAEIAVRCHGRG